jgi:hypothetical protein
MYQTRRQNKSAVWCRHQLTPRARWGGGGGSPSGGGGSGSGVDGRLFRRSRSAGEAAERLQHTPLHSVRPRGQQGGGAPHDSSPPPPRPGMEHGASTWPYVSPPASSLSGSACTSRTSSSGGDGGESSPCRRAHEPPPRGGKGIRVARQGAATHVRGCVSPSLPASTSSGFEEAEPPLFSPEAVTEQQVFPTAPTFGRGGDLASTCLHVLRARVLTPIVASHLGAWLIEPQ